MPNQSWREGNPDYDAFKEEFYAGVNAWNQGDRINGYTEQELDARLSLIGDPERWDTNPLFVISETGQFSVAIQGEEFYLGADQDAFHAIYEWCKDHGIDIEDIIYEG